MLSWIHKPKLKTWTCLNMQVAQQTDKLFICSLLFRGKVIYSQKCYGDLRSAKQKATRAREFLAQKCSEL